MNNIQQDSTILQLKESIAVITTIVPIRQRLIFSGKQLKPDDKTISSFKIIDNSSIHLFPLPEAVPQIEAVASTVRHAIT